jgi:hypothetical protein
MELGLLVLDMEPLELGLLAQDMGPRELALFPHPLHSLLQD